MFSDSLSSYLEASLALLMRGFGSGSCETGLCSYSMRLGRPKYLRFCFRLCGFYFATPETSRDPGDQFREPPLDHRQVTRSESMESTESQRRRPGGRLTDEEIAQTLTTSTKPHLARRRLCTCTCPNNSIDP